MLNTTFGYVPWDDSHHPSLSMTNGEHDGRWIFINGNNTPRIARIDLSTMTTAEIIQIPNSAGNHSSPYVTQNTEYAVAGTRFSVPIPQKDVAIEDFATEFNGAISFIKANEAGKMAVAFQVLMPGYDYDLARPGKGPSGDWVFFSSYNTEQAYTKKEVEASRNDKDVVAAINFKMVEQCVAGGKAETWPSEYMHVLYDDATHTARSETIRGVKVIKPADCPGSVYYLPTPKSPHGIDVDPTGEFLVAGGKLATILPVHSFSKMQKAITDKAFDGEKDGIPIFKYEAVNFCEIQNPGLGPLHTEFDGQGNGYTSVFISSEIVKYTLPGCEVVDRIPTYYSIGHLMIPGGDTRKPYGKYVIALNKITKDRYLPTGPELTQAGQLIDITGDKMKLLLDFPMIGEPHYAQAIDAKLIQDKQVKFFKLTENKHPYVTKSEAETKVTRSGKTVHVNMTAIRSHFAPDNIEGVQVGDTVLFHVTNLEQDWDVPHGFATIGSANDAELLIMPGETRTLKWVATVPRRLPVLLHGLLLRAAPGDAGVRARESRREQDAASSGRSERNRERGTGDGAQGSPAPLPHPPSPNPVPSTQSPYPRMSSRARILLTAASLLLALAFVLPLWAVYLQAPQYPEGLGMLIRVNDVIGLKPNDLENINNLNHYIGMKRIEPDSIPELRIMPYIVAGLMVLGLAAAAIGRRWMARAWVIVFAAVAIVGLADFYKWEYDYGHDLDIENAIIKVPGMNYQPPLIGTKQLLNFRATSIPAAGGYVLMLSLALGVVAVIVDRRRTCAAKPRLSIATAPRRPWCSDDAPHAIMLLGLVALGCQRAPRPLVAGVDACDFCRMTVSDTRFGGEIQSRTGKIHTFDAVECLASFHLAATDRDDVRGAWVSDFEDGRLVPVDSAVFLRDARVSSPMGRSLVAFAPEHRAGLEERYGGHAMTWSEVRESLRTKGLEPGATPRDTSHAHTHGATP